MYYQVQGCFQSLAGHLGRVQVFGPVQALVLFGGIPFWSQGFGQGGQV